MVEKCSVAPAPATTLSPGVRKDAYLDVDFTGKDWKTKYGFDAITSYHNGYKTYTFGRPNWLLRQRCTQSGCVPCDRAADGCLVASSGSGSEIRSPSGSTVKWYKAEISSSSDLKRTEMSINMKCDVGRAVDLEIGSRNVQNGIVKILWNGVEVQNIDGYRDPKRLCRKYYTAENRHTDGLGDENGATSSHWAKPCDQPTNSWHPFEDSGRGLYWSKWENGVLKFRASEQIPGETWQNSGLPAEDGDNELTISFERNDAAAAATVEVMANVFTVPLKFAECEDHKVCLGKAGLGNHWDSQGAQDLRTSTLLQYKCMQDTSMPGNAEISGVCKAWVKCLKNQGRFDSVQKLLEAFGADGAPALPQYSANSAKSDHKYDSVCYRRLLCANQNVCDSWKAAVGCPGSATALLDEPVPQRSTDDLLILMQTEANAKLSAGWNCG
jgi:hypothetical protein